MARGFDGINQASADLENRRSSGGPSALWFRLQNGEEAIVRFLEQDDDVVWTYMHEVPVDGRSFGRPVPCLDEDRDGTPCPGCEHDLPRKVRGFINVIWEDAPVFHRDENGRNVRDKHGDPIITGHKPQVAIWSSGIKVFDNLSEINNNYKGLSSRKFKIKRKGEGLSTTYVVNPADPDSGAEEFSKQEKALESNKYPLADFIKPPPYEEFEKDIIGAENMQDGGAGEARRRNPFMRN